MLWRLFCVFVFGFGIYKGIAHFNKEELTPLKPTPYMVVYGRDKCGNTQATMQELNEAGIRYEYQSVDEAGVSDALHHRMTLAGLDTSYYLLPVVDLNNHLLIHPDDQKLVLDAQTQLGGNGL